MGILDDLRHKIEKLGDKAREGFDDARDKAGDLLDDAKDKAGDLLDDAKGRLAQEDEHGVPLTESSDVRPDATGTDVVTPAAADLDPVDLDAAELDEAELVDDPAAAAPEPLAEAEPVDLGAPDLDAPHLDAAELDAEELVDDPAAAAREPLAEAGTAPDTAADLETGTRTEPGVETGVDPYDQPLTETIGEELAAAGLDREALDEVVQGTPDRDDQP